jgi:hypothetical protein
MYPLLFLLAAGLNILLGLHSWAGVLTGSLNDPDSYMRLLRIEQGIRAGHLSNMVARDDSGAGVMVEWSRLLDGVLWLMAAPLAAIIGWHRALYAAGVALGPLSVGLLGMVLAWVVEPFAGSAYLWTAAAAAAILPGFLTFAVPGVVHYHIMLLVLIAVTVGFAARAWRNDPLAGFFTGVSGGFAIWLTPETMPFVLMAYAALLLRWFSVPLAQTMLYCAAGFFDVLGVALTVDPPEGGYLVPEIDRLSFVYVVLALLLLAGAAVLLRFEQARKPWSRPAGFALMALLLGLWVGLFPKVALGPYGVMSPEDMRRFFGVMAELQPLRGSAGAIFLLPGVLALFYALWRAYAGRGRWLWLYIALCTLVTLWLGAKFILFVGFSSAVAAAMIPLAMSEVSGRLELRPSLAMLSRIGILVAMFAVPQAVAFTPRAAMGSAAEAGAFPDCALRHIGPLLAPETGEVVLAQAEDTPEILYRSEVETAGSLYQHGVPAYLRARAAWRAPPGGQPGAEVRATKAGWVLFCPQAGRYTPVADLPKTTLWDALEAGEPPAWLHLAGTNSDGWRLYKISP